MIVFDPKENMFFNVDGRRKKRVPLPDYTASFECFQQTICSILSEHLTLIKFERKARVINLSWRTYIGEILGDSFTYTELSEYLDSPFTFLNRFVWKVEGRLK